MKNGSVRKTLCGLVSEVAAPKRAITVAIIKPSWSDDDKRSSVTAPPNLMPGIQDGRSMIGTVKIVLPGIGTPIRIPTTARMTRMTAPIRRAIQ